MLVGQPDAEDAFDACDVCPPSIEASDNMVLEIVEDILLGSLWDVIAQKGVTLVELGLVL